MQLPEGQALLQLLGFEEASEGGSSSCPEDGSRLWRAYLLPDDAWDHVLTLHALLQAAEVRARLFLVFLLNERAGSRAVK